jgi:light-harvesting protein B-800-850 alpha chain
MNVFDYKPLEQDYRIWLVVNPAKWLFPMFAALLVIALAVHVYAFSLPGNAWTPDAPAAPAAVEAPAQ